MCFLDFQIKRVLKEASKHMRMPKEVSQNVLKSVLKQLQKSKE